MQVLLLSYAAVLACAARSNPARIASIQAHYACMIAEQTPNCRAGGADLLNAADWYSRHTGKPVVVMSDRLADSAGRRDDDNDDVADASAGLKP